MEKLRKETKKCSFCEKEPLYFCDFLGIDNRWTRIQGCDEHKELAIMKQQNVAMKERLEELTKQI